MKAFRPPINLGARSSRHGKSTMTVKCPFCGRELEVYIWSFAGSGKRCFWSATWNVWLCRR